MKGKNSLTTYIIAVLTLLIYDAIMQTVTIELTNDKALQALRDLEGKRFIKIIPGSDRISVALPGKPLSSKQFKDLIVSRENGSSMRLKEARAKWKKKEKQLLSLTK